MAVSGATGPRSKARAFELRAQVTAEAYDFLVGQAAELGRPRAWHVGLIVEAYAAASKHLTAGEQAQLDAILRQPEQLLARLSRLLEADRA